MSGKEEVWEDVEQAEAEAEEEEEDTTINNSDVVVRYKKAGAWCNEALQAVIDACKPGAKVWELCKLGDDTINAKLKTMFKGTDKGIAFPTCVSVNNCVCHNSPGPTDEEKPQELKLGDVVRIDLSVQVDGYCAQVAHTVQVTESGELGDDEKAHRAITAAYNVLNTALRQMRPGMTSYAVTDVIEKAAAHYSVTPADGVLSHNIKRFIVDGFRCIPQKRVAEQIVHDYEFEKAQVWTLDIVMTTGKGKLREEALRPFVYKLALDSDYTVKMESAKGLTKEIDSRYQTFPFAVRNLETKKARLGLNEMVKHGAAVAYPVLFEREAEVVGQFKITVLITNKKIEPITGLKPQKGPALPAYTDEALIAANKLSLSLEKKKTAA